MHKYNGFGRMVSWLTVGISVNYLVIDKETKNVEKFVFEESVSELSEQASQDLLSKYGEFMKGKPFRKEVQKLSSIENATFENSKSIVVVMKQIDNKILEYPIIPKEKAIKEHNKKQQDIAYEGKLSYLDHLLNILKDNIDYAIKDDFLMIDEKGGWHINNRNGVYISVDQMKEDLKNKQSKYNGMLRLISKKAHNYKQMNK